MTPSQTNTNPDVHCHPHFYANFHPFINDDIYTDRNFRSYLHTCARFPCLLFRHTQRIAAIG